MEHVTEKRSRWRPIRRAAGLQCSSLTTTGTITATTGTPRLPLALQPGTPDPTGPAPRLSRTDTPGRMRILALAVAVVAALSGVVGSSVLTSRTSELSTARDDAAQLERLESVRTAVVEADALAAAAYLAGGLEPPARRAEYEERLDAAQRGLAAAAARATGDESVRLGGVASALSQASGLVEQARANSRQGFPVGAAYQRSASALIRAEVLPVLDEIAGETGDRTVDAVGSGNLTVGLLWLCAVVALAVIGVASWWMLRRTNRVVNIGLAAAAMIIAGITVLSSVVVGSSTSTAVDTIDVPYRAATSYARARTAAFDARSNEALTLIARGNGGAFETRWQQLSAEATAYLERVVELDGVRGGGVADSFAGYLEAHGEVRQLDDDGRHDEAVARAQQIGIDDWFGRFDVDSAAALDELAATVDADLGDARSGVSWLRWTVLGAGLIAAVAAFAGVARRIQEYR